jgi:putative membrane protein
MHNPFMTFSTWAGAAMLAGVMLVIPGTTLAQGGMGSAQNGQALPQAPVSPGQQQMNDQRGIQDSGAGNQQMEKMEARARASTFVSNALAGNLAEVQLGQLAMQKSSDPQIKQFAQHMIDDHTKLSNDMKLAAEQLGVHAPTQLDKKNRKTVEKLSALSGTAFDLAYMKEMVKDHKRDLQEFKDAAASSQNPALKMAADHGAQVISAHLEQAEQITRQQTASKGN